MTQSAFRAALLNPDLPAPPGLTDPAGRPAGRRFDVYRNNVTVSLTEALRQAFPVIRKLVGEAFFTALAQEHLRAHPPRSPVLMFYGEAMPAFLEAFPPVAHLGYLPDIARLELALRHAYHAADARPIDPAALQTLDPAVLAGARVRLAPAVRLLRSRWPVHAIWRANTAGGPAPVMRAEDVLIVRPAFDPEPRLLPEGAALFVTALAGGASLGAAALAAGDHLDLPATIAMLLAGGAIAGIATEDSHEPSA